MRAGEILPSEDLSKKGMVERMGEEKLQVGMGWGRGENE